jgi:hypothetical protein
MVVLSLCMVACGAVVGVGPAFAGVSRFGTEGEGAGELHSPNGVAVDQESGDVYLMDGLRLEKWGSEGPFLWASGWGVADGHTQAPQICTTLCFPGLSGTGGGQFGFAEGVAVDNDVLSPSHGDVYVFDLGSYRVEKFDAAGNFLLAFGHEVNASTHGNVCLAGEACQEGTRGAEPWEFKPEDGEEVAVSSAGMVLVGDKERVQEFSPGGAYEGQITLPGVGFISALAVDSTGDVYVKSELGGVRKFDSGGVEQGEPRDASGSPFTIAVGPSDELFIEDGPGATHHILEFDAAGSEVASFDAGGESIESGIAWGDSIGELYVLGRGVVRLVAPPAAGPHLALAGSDAAGLLQPTTATLNALLNPEGRETSYHFEYGTTNGYGASTPPGTLEAGFEDQPAGAELSGLLPRTTYHFRVVASNSAGTFIGPDETFVTLPPALIDSESVSQVTSTGATLATEINPLGRDTTYRFEYGPTVAYGTSVPVPNGDAGSGTVDVTLSAPIEGLAAGTAYHYRVVAVNSLGTVEGGDRVFSTKAAQASGLLDGRAWEMVSPPDKHGATLEALSPLDGGLTQAAQDGGAIAYLATGPVDAEPSGNRSLLFTQVLSTRGANGWVSRGISAPTEVPAWSPTLSAGYKLFNDDLSVGLDEPEDEAVLSPGAAKGVPYRREADGSFTPLVLAAGLPSGTELNAHTGVEMFVGASRDLSHIILNAHVPLLPGVPNNGRNALYEWSGGTLQVVSVLPNGKQAAEEGEDGALGHEGFGIRHAVSDDGSRIVWSLFGNGGHLYVRDTRLEGTVQLDVVEAGAQGGQSGPFFQTASADGSKVFFTDNSRLTRDANSHSTDLYMCEVGEAAGKPTCALKDLSVDGNAGEAAQVEGNVLGASEDGRYVYFVAAGALAAGATPGNCAPKGSGSTYVPGAVCNLYVYDTVTGVRRFVAALSNEDVSDWSPGNGGASILDTVKVSPNGRYLAFMSLRSLTGYDNLDAHGGQPDAEVFLYDANTGRLVCASCNPSGARPTGVFDAPAVPGLLVDRYNASEWYEGGGHWLAGSIPGWDKESQNGRNSWYQSAYLSDSGRLFFNAADALVPVDTNGLEDVYEYEPGGVGGCSDGTGCVGLISSGTSGEESALLDAGESGGDVFFLTASRIAPQDTDTLLDVYDAHVCTTVSPCVAAPAVSPPPVPCASGDGCRGLVSAQPGVFGAPASIGVVGAGNLAPPPAVKAVLKGKPVTRARKLANALRACRRSHRHKQRVSCEVKARRLYGKGVKANRAVHAGATGKGR